MNKTHCLYVSEVFSSGCFTLYRRVLSSYQFDLKKKFNISKQSSQTSIGWILTHF